MIKLMIVDDEQIVRDGIKFIIEKNFKDQIEIVDMARTGREAIEKFEEWRPNLVLMDIQMPGINGIEAIRAIKSQNPGAKCIIISAYEQFEYAKQALELGVKEYILKPINRNKLVDTVARVVKEIEDEKRIKQREMENQEKMDKILPVLEHGLIYAILMNNDYHNEVENYYSLFGIEKDAAYVMVVEFGDDSAAGKMRNKIGTGVKSQIHYESVRNMLKYKCRCIVGPMIINRMTVLVHTDGAQDEYDQRLGAIELAESLKESIEKIVGADLRIGIGSCYNIYEANLSYIEALKALGKIEDGEILHTKDVIDLAHPAEGQMSLFKGQQDAILEKMTEGNSQETENLLLEYFGKLGIFYKQYPEDAKNLIAELMILLYSEASRNHAIEEGISYTVYLKEIQDMDNFYELQSACIHRITDISQRIKDEKELKVSHVIAQAKQYIDANYNKEIGLKETSEAVSISPQYFSKVFKEELGVNFIDYLTTVRMEHAKSMLKEKRLSIKEICFEIGYNDPNYFSRLFKKNAGVSPTEYE